LLTYKTLAMKKTILPLLLLASFSFTHAQTKVPELGIGIDAGFPVGDLNESHKFGIGGTLKFAYNFNPSTAVTFQSGYMSFIGKDISGGGIVDKWPNLNFIPFKFGARYTFTGGFYMEPQLGLTSMSTKFMGHTSSTTGFTYAFNIGYHTTPGIDVSTRYETISKEGNGSFVGLRVAYNFLLEKKK